MRFSNYHSGAALGITRRGTDDGRIVRNISMAGFGGLPQGDAPNPNHESNVNPNTGCAKTTSWSTYCGCMYGDKDRISTDKKGSGDFSNGSARWACQLAAEVNFAPWNCEGIIMTLVGSRGKADPLRHMSGTLTSGAKGAEYRRCAAKAVEQLKAVVPGIEETLQSMGLIPRAGTDGGAQPALDLAPYRASVMVRADSDLISLIQQFQASPPDPLSSPENAAIYTVAVEENNYRVANPCPAGQARTTRNPPDAAGRASCSAPPRRIGSGLIRPIPVSLPDFMRTGSDAAPNTMLIAGGIAVAVAAIFLLKK